MSRWMLRWFSMYKLIHVIYHAHQNKQKGHNKNLNQWSNTFNKIQYPSMRNKNRENIMYRKNIPKNKKAGI